MTIFVKHNFILDFTENLCTVLYNLGTATDYNSFSKKTVTIIFDFKGLLVPSFSLASWTLFRKS